MRQRRLGVAVLVLVGAGVVLSASAAFAAAGADWPFAGGNRANTRYQVDEKAISVKNAASLRQKWVFTTAGDLTATPAVQDGTVYVPDSGGSLYAIDQKTGRMKWSSSIPSATGIPGDYSSTTPAVSGKVLVVGTQRGRVIAFDKVTGVALWRTWVDSDSSTAITQSPLIDNGRVYVGADSTEDQVAALSPGYTCCQFRGSFSALDLATGQILWRTYTTPTGYSGAAVSGGSPALDASRNVVYIGTGHNYSVPDGAASCALANPTGLCTDAADLFDSIIALDTETGRILWATRTQYYDTWTFGCLTSGLPCPSPTGSAYGFAQGPALFSVKAAGGKRVDVVGAGAKSGAYWELDAQTGRQLWRTQTGPGSYRGGHGLGSAIDGTRIYTGNTSGSTGAGAWSALDPATGQILWQTADPLAGSPLGPVTTANGVVYGCSLDPTGHMYALNASTGAILWSFASGGSCGSGAAISGGMLFWGSGYSSLGTANDKLYAFAPTK